MAYALFLYIYLLLKINFYNFGGSEILISNGFHTEM